MFDYDLDRSPVVNLSNATLSFLDLIESRLSLTNVAGPWGLVNDNLLILKLENQPQSKVGKVLIFALADITDVLEKLFPTATLAKAEQCVLLKVG